jgi:copper transporter 1
VTPLGGDCRSPKSLARFGRQQQLRSLSRTTKTPQIASKTSRRDNLSIQVTIFPQNTIHTHPLRNLPSPPTMAHSHMDHGHMDHGHDDTTQPMQPMCSMNMLFTWSTDNLCIVFRSWRITSTFSLLLSLLAIVALTAGYEALRESSRRYEERVARRIESVSRKYLLFHLCSTLGNSSKQRHKMKLMLVCSVDTEAERSSLLGFAGNVAEGEEKKAKVVKAAFYGVQVFYSFFIM